MIDQKYYDHLNSEVYKDMDKTAIIFNRFLKPRLAELLGGKIENIEGSTKDDMVKAFDRFAGIDAWLIKSDEGIRGIASRIQLGDKNWRSFTIRKERETGHSTEYDKRKYSMTNNWIYPFWIVQAFVSKDGQNLLGFGLAKMCDIIEAIDKGLCYERQSGSDQVGKATFYVCNWDTLKTNNYFFYEE